MKNLYLAVLAVLLASMLLVPLVTISLPKENNSEILPDSTAQKKVLLKISETDEIRELDVDDYIFGVVAAEMSADYSIEAIKSQAVCAYTFRQNAFGKCICLPDRMAVCPQPGRKPGAADGGPGYPAHQPGICPDPAGGSAVAGS